MALKYQSEIDNLNLSISCPQNVYQLINEQLSHRFSFEPLTNPLNFLPNIVYDKKRQANLNYNKFSEESKCLRCGASFYIKKEDAVSAWNLMSEQNRLNLGYTHLASGVLSGTDGYVSEPSTNGHFSFYEDDSANLASKFTLSEL